VGIQVRTHSLRERGDSLNMKPGTESLENVGSYQTAIELGAILEERITSPAEGTHCPVNSYNEWDPLEEVIVGIVDGASFPSWHIAMEAPLPDDQREIFQKNAGRPFPAERIAAAKRDLEEFVHILEAEGVKVRRPVPMDQLQPYSAPGWASTGLYDAMPRDVLLVFGNEIIECPLAWRSRYYGTFAFRPILKEYFHSGAKWSAGPKPELKDELYDYDWRESKPGEPTRLVITEFEPTFDAADFIRCGRDIFAQKSNVTNEFGIEWLRRHLGDDYRIHVCDFNDPHPMHIDATLVPLAPGKVLINRERVPVMPAIFKGWDVFHAPKPVIPHEHPLYMTSKWINMNILMLDEQRVIVERQDEPMFKAMKEWGFKPILCNFRNFNSFGGSFHCATLDVRRRGTLQSYF
jgi:glycine amidinotransferase